MAAGEVPVLRGWMGLTATMMIKICMVEECWSLNPDSEFKLLITMIYAL